MVIRYSPCPVSRLSHNLKSKSLYVRYIEFSRLELFYFICSLPFLENLNLVSEKVLEHNGNDLHGITVLNPFESLKLVAPRLLLSLALARAGVLETFVG